MTGTLNLQRSTGIKEPTASAASRQHFVVLGAGVAGLGAARELLKRGHRVTLIEKGARVGGLARTFERDGFRFDIGGHRFHSNNPSVMNWLRELLKEDLLTVPRTSHIRMGNKFVNYPIKFPQSLSIFTPMQAAKILFSYLSVGITERGRQDISFEDWVVRRYGRGLYQAFFEPYTEKVWGISCDQLSATWAHQRIGIPSMWRAIKDAILPPENAPATAISQFYYPKHGFGMIPDAMNREILDMGGTVHCSTSILEMVPTNYGFEVTVQMEDGSEKTYKADQVVSTIPLDALLKSIPDQFGSREMLDRYDLEYRELICVFVALDREQVSKDSWTYFPMKDVVFGRTHEPKNWSTDMVPSASTTSLAAEIFCGRGDPIWNLPDSAIADKVVEHMDHIGWIHRTDVLNYWVLRVPNAYPVYRIGYEQKLAAVKDYVGQFEGLHLVGRTGSFRYMNSDGVIEDVFRFLEEALPQEGSAVMPLPNQLARWV